MRATASKGKYTGAELRDPAIRPGADDARGLPSRVGDRLHYRGGRVTDLAGNPIEPEATSSPGVRG